MEGAEVETRTDCERPIVCWLVCLFVLAGKFEFAAQSLDFAEFTTKLAVRVALGAQFGVAKPVVVVIVCPREFAPKSL